MKKSTIKNNYPIIILLSIISFAYSCEVPQHLAAPKDFKNQTKGLFMECKVFGTEYTGEIITVDEDSVSLLLLNSTNTLALSKNDIRSFDVIVSLTSDDPQKVANRAALTMLPVIAHGWWMVFSVPINAIATTSVGKGAAQATYRMECPEHISWEKLSKFARYPQGLPEGLGLEDVK